MTFLGRWLRRRRARRIAAQWPEDRKARFDFETGTIEVPASCTDPEIMRTKVDEAIREYEAATGRRIVWRGEGGP